MKGVHVITEMETITDKVNEKDSYKEGSTIVDQQYKAFGRPYMVDYAITGSVYHEPINEQAPFRGRPFRD